MPCILREPMLRLEQGCIAVSEEPICILKHSRVRKQRQVTIFCTKMDVHSALQYVVHFDVFVLYVKHYLCLRRHSTPIIKAMLIFRVRTKIIFKSITVNFIYFRKFISSKTTIKQCAVFKTLNNIAYSSEFIFYNHTN